ADNAPQEGRAQFLGGWRLCGDVGNAIGPGIISLITLVASLGVASVAIGVLGWIGSTWLARSIPRFNSPLGTRHQRKGVERKGLE
ncbi:MAG TPA: MFS transporter, partial [Candidatus Avipropionibacterium avicola]|nr:MFS transporter [Candidatus Avipropionibacterium avicola]